MTSICRRRLLAGLSASAAIAALGGCQTAPGTGVSEFNLLNADDEAKMGRESHPQIVAQFGGVYDDPEVAAWVAGIGQRLVRVTETPEAEFRFTVLNSPIVNAMALPGGYIYVTRGLLALTGSEAELAGVIGHEIGHVLGRHSAQRYSRGMAAGVFTTILGAVVGVPGLADVAQMGAGAWLQAYSRENEMEADHLGLRYMKRGGWTPQAMVSMLDNLREHGRLEMLMAGRDPDQVDETHFMATHPRTIDRVQAAINEAGGNGEGALGREALLKHVDGMIYGDDPDEGVIRGRRFLHPGMGFAFDAPPDFRLVNGSKAVTATDGKGASVVFDGGRASGSDMKAYISRVWMPRARLSGLEYTEIGGMPAATAATTGRAKQGNVDVRLVAIRFSADQVFRFTMITPQSRTQALDADMRRCAYSFRRLSGDERESAQPLRIRVKTVRRGQTAADLAAAMDASDWKEERFRVLNSLKSGENPAPGSQVKTISF